MSSLDQLKQTFFEECGEALEQIEAGLTELRDGAGNADTINAVFRAVHSVKGGAGIFGFEALVNFAHVFETVLDAMRAETLAATGDVIDVLLPASDTLADFVAMSQAGTAIPAGYGGDAREALERLMGEGGAAGEDPAPADFEDLDFTPVRIDDFDAGGDAADPMRSLSIVFRPKPEMLRRGSEPLHLLRDLRRLGDLELAAETDAIPPLAEMEPDLAYVGWTGTLSTASPLEQVRELFDFAANDCELSIEEPAAGSEGIESPSAAILPLVSPVAQPAPAEPAAPVGQAAPPAPAEPVAAAAAATKPAATTTRVELEKIDRVVNMVGELVIAQAMLRQIMQNLPVHVADGMSQMLEEVSHHTRELKDSIMSMRAQPVSTVFQRMTRLVREVAGRTGKKVRLEFAGENTEVDRSIIERLSDPLTHIIRNSIDHGIEAPADRLRAGKGEEGAIRLAAEQRGSRIVIEVTDDGAGINTERVLRKARERGLVGADAVLTEDEISNLIFLPGFSTAEAVSDISGRGVGMDVVRRNIQDLGGRIALKSEAGRGMTIQLALPLTLAVMDGMVIKVGRETYVMPMPVIVECLRPSQADLHDLVGTAGMLQLRGELLPLMPLGALLDVGPATAESTERVVIVTETSDGSRFGLVADELCGHQQVVIKSIEESYGSVPGIAGATILGNGRVAFILDVDQLSDLAGRQPTPKAA